jgi:enamine deaminase RidA (YjgF/YER057c/UK114 family)
MPDTSFAPAEIIAPSLERRRLRGAHLTSLTAGRTVEQHVMILPLAGENVADSAARLQAILGDTNSVAVRIEAFGSAAALAELEGRLRTMPQCGHCPVNAVIGGACTGQGLAGIYVWAISGVALEDVVLHGRVVGQVFELAHARHCVLGAIGPRELQSDRETQARQVFEQIHAALATVGFQMQDVVRTWMFLDDILGWYGPFNLVRREAFARMRVTPDRLPASTGVGVANPLGAAACAAALAVQPLNGSVSIRVGASPLQCPAPAYGSCFSRAMELEFPGSRQLLVSGTASLAPDGGNAHEDDPAEQVLLTMAVVEALLAAGGFGFRDVCRATAYFKRTEDHRFFLEWLLKNEVQLPVVNAQADICRPELYFEIELDALVAKPGP